jgi:hypothetical protein
VPELGGWSRERSGEADIERPNEKAIYNVCRSREKEREGQIKTERDKETKRESERQRETERERPGKNKASLGYSNIDIPCTFRVHFCSLSASKKTRPVWSF